MISRLQNENSVHYFYESVQQMIVNANNRMLLFCLITLKLIPLIKRIYNVSIESINKLFIVCGINGILINTINVNAIIKLLYDIPKRIHFTPYKELILILSQKIKNIIIDLLVIFQFFIRIFTITYQIYFNFIFYI